MECCKSNLPDSDPAQYLSPVQLTNVRAYDPRSYLCADYVEADPSPLRVPVVYICNNDRAYRAPPLQVFIQSVSFICGDSQISLFKASPFEGKDLATSPLVRTSPWDIPWYDPWGPGEDPSNRLPGTTSDVVCRHTATNSNIPWDQAVAKLPANYTDDVFNAQLRWGQCLAFAARTTNAPMHYVLRVTLSRHWGKDDVR